MKIFEIFEIENFENFDLKIFIFIQIPMKFFEKFFFRSKKISKKFNFEKYL